MPARLIQHLIKRLHHHGATPDHRGLDIDQEADGHRLHPIRHQRLHAFTIARLRLLASQTKHLRLRRTVDVGIQNTHGRPFLCQRKSQIHRRRALADSTFAGGDGNDVFHARK